MTEVESMVARFGQAQLSLVLQSGLGIGLSPITTATCLLQVTAASLAGIAPTETVALMRAYADTIEAGPGESPAKTAAVARFTEAATAFADVARASADFPAPKGRA